MTGTVHALLLAASSSSKTTGSSDSSTFLIFIVLIGVVAYFLLIRPQKQRQRRQREQASAIGVGDEVVTVGGVVGRVIAIDGERVTILSGGDTVGFAASGSEPSRLVFLRTAVSRKIEPVVTDEDDTPFDADGADHDAATRSNGSSRAALDGHSDVSHDAADGAESEDTST